MTAAADLGRRATKARKSWERQHRHVSDERMAAEIFSQTGVYFNRGTLGKLWSGKVDPHSVGIETILSIAKFLEVDPDEFGPVIAERRRQLAALMFNEDTLAGAGAGGRSSTFSFDDPAARDRSGPARVGFRYGVARFCGCSSEAEHQLPKLRTRVRFPSPALARRPRSAPVSGELGLRRYGPEIARMTLA